VDLPQKLAFVVQPNRLQGLIWQAILKSQKFSVILEAPNSDLADCVTQISEAGLTLPDIILLEAEIPGLNPYEFCRWCREQFPNIKVFLTRFHAQPLSDTERRWAQKQGAANFFNGFNRSTLMSNAAASIKAIMAAVDEPFLDERALLTVLLNVRRQIAAPSPVVSKPQPSPNGSPGVNGRASAKSPAAQPGPGTTTPVSPSDVLHDLDWVASGLRALNRPKPETETQPDHAVPPPALNSAQELNQTQAPDRASTPVRRYRGVAY
jgi:CheY-like chemotaxis protein